MGRGRRQEAITGNMFDYTEENLVTSRVLGTILSVTSERVRQLEDTGVFTSVSDSHKKMFDLVPSIQSYIAYLKGQATGDTLEELAAQDLRYKTARADKAELEVAELRGTMHRAEDVEAITSDIIAGLRAALLSLPGRLAVDAAEAKTATEASAVIKAGVDTILNDTAEYKYDANAYRKRVRERQKWVTVEEQQKIENTKAAGAKKSSKKPASSSRSSAKASGRRKT